MVNTEEFSKRLKVIMNYYSISASQLAEKIDIQRSSISHILSGRNKPSLDFVMKILNTFPEVELYWLLNGIGNFPKKAIKDFPQNTPPPIENTSTKEIVEITEPSSSPRVATSDIERIVVFYKDGTFKNYIP